MGEPPARAVEAILDKIFREGQYSCNPGSGLVRLVFSVAIGQNLMPFQHFPEKSLQLASAERSLSSAAVETPDSRESFPHPAGMT